MRTRSSVALACAGVLVLAGALLPLRQHVNVAVIALLLLLAVVGSALRLGRSAAFAAALVASLALNFLFIPPYYTLTIASAENLAAFAVFLITGLVIAHLSSAAREHARRADEQRLHAERLYADLQQAVEANKERDAQIQAEKIKSAFLDAVTHDLRTPLTSVKAAATSLLQERWSSEDRIAVQRMHDLLAVIVEEADRLNRFIENVISMAKRRESATAPHREPLSVGSLVEAALERARTQLRERRVEVDVPEDLPTVNVDRDAIAEVLYTLLDNAVKYSSTYSRIDITARQTDGHLTIAVEDEGRGIPAELRSRVFEKYARADSREHGFGMGLAIAKAILDAHGGRIWIEGRRTGRGVVVSFSLPLEAVPEPVHP